MHYVIGVEHNKSVQDAPEDGGCILLLILSSLLDLIEEFLAVQVLDDQVDVVVRLKDLVELQDIRVPYLPE